MLEVPEHTRRMREMPRLAALRNAASDGVFVSPPPPREESGVAEATAAP